MCARSSEASPFGGASSNASMRFSSVVIWSDKAAGLLCSRDYRVPPRQDHGPRGPSSRPGGPIFLDAARLCPNNGRVSRRTLTLLAVCTAAALVPAAASARVDAAPRALGKALAVPHVAKARTGAIAVDLDTGEVVFSLH